ncbi:MAG: dihydrofolate reductase [Bacteroidota bacterium]
MLIMLKSIIVAKTINHAIGRDQKLLCHLPRDLQHFRDTTMGHHVIMGRKTFAAIGKPLYGRHLIVMTRNLSYRAANCIIRNSLTDALEVADKAGETEVFIAGGEEIYKAALPLADRIYTTEINTYLVGDTFFPALELGEWDEVQRVHCTADQKHAYDFDFVMLQRNGI